MATLLYQQLETLIEQEAYEDVLKICHECKQVTCLFYID
jgi:hypothetical protein